MIPALGADGPVALLSTVPESTRALVHLNAALNTLAALLLVTGLILIRRGRVVAHARAMLSAFGVSCLFLISYLTYHYTAGHVSFTHPGAVRYLYYILLATHIPLAATVPVLALITITFAALGTGWRGAAQLDPQVRARFLARHRQFARWTLPIWMYVSISGVAVYVMLYHLWPPVN